MRASLPQPSPSRMVMFFLSPTNLHSMDTNAVIQSLLSSPQFAALQKEEVEIAGRDNTPSRKIIVIEQCAFTDARSGRVDMEIKADPLAREFVELSEGIGLARLYTDLASVSFGDVPAFMEFVAMRSADNSAWINAAMKINPSLFAWLSAIEKTLDEAAKKEPEKTPADNSRIPAEVYREAEAMNVDPYPEPPRVIPSDPPAEATASPDEDADVAQWIEELQQVFEVRKVNAAITTIPASASKEAAKKMRDAAKARIKELEAQQQ